MSGVNTKVRSKSISPNQTDIREHLFSPLHQFPILVLCILVHQFPILVLCILVWCNIWMLTLLWGPNVLVLCNIWMLTLLWGPNVLVLCNIWMLTLLWGPHVSLLHGCCIDDKKIYFKKGVNYFSHFLVSALEPCTPWRFHHELRVTDPNLEGSSVVLICLTM